MTLFPELRADLVEAMDHGPRRRRPPRPLLAAVPAVALALLVAVLVWPRSDGELRPQPRIGHASERMADLPQPIQQVLSSPREMRMRPGSPLSVVRLTDAGALGWTTVAYISSGHAITFTSAPDGLEASGLSVHGNSVFPAGRGTVTQVNVDLALARGADHYLVSGTVDARVTDLEVELGGEHATAMLSPTTLSLRDTRGGTIRVRAFAAAFTPDRLKGDRVAQPRFEIDLEGGQRTHATGPRFCVSHKCGVSYPRAAG